jgi:hypothetical protein
MSWRLPSDSIKETYRWELIFNGNIFFSHNKSPMIKKEDK